MSIGVPLPHVSVTPPQPNPTTERPVPPDAEEFRAALYDGRRELMRARAAALPYNVILGGFTPALIAGKLVLSRGVAQIRIPADGWTDTYPPTSELFAPTETPANLLPGAATDGAYRAERRTATSIAAGNGTTGPATGDSVVYLTYDETQPDRVRAAWHLVSGFALDEISVPVAWVRVAGGAVTMVRDLRPMPPWRPRYAQRVYDIHDAPEDRGHGFLLDATGAATLIPVDVGSFWLSPGTAVLLTASVLLESTLARRAHEGLSLEFNLSRGDASDAFAAPHYWYSSGADQTRAPRWATSFMNVGRNWFSATHLFLPRVAGSGEAAQTVPGVFHFNGLFTTRVRYAWERDAPALVGLLPESPLAARMAYLKAELVQVRETDLGAGLSTVPPLRPGSLREWHDESFPPVPTQRTA